MAGLITRGPYEPGRGRLLTLTDAGRRAAGDRRAVASPETGGDR
jgi:hypothetical protein